MRHDPPGQGTPGYWQVERPSPVTGIQEVAVQAGQGLAVRIEHRQTNPQGCRVMIEMTPATKSTAHKPLERHLTKAGATDAESYFELGESGATYLLENPRHNVAPGERFGIRVTIISEDGIKGRPRECDLIRVQPVESQPGTEHQPEQAQHLNNITSAGKPATPSLSLLLLLILTSLAPQLSASTTQVVRGPTNIVRVLADDFNHSGDPNLRGEYS